MVGPHEQLVADAITQIGNGVRVLPSVRSVAMRICVALPTQWRFAAFQVFTVAISSSQVALVPDWLRCVDTPRVPIRATAGVM